MNYLCKQSWKRHTKGDVITDWEYNKLPVEIKKHFELIEVVKFEKQELEDKKSEFVVNQENPTVVEVDAMHHLFSPKKKNIAAVADIEKIIDDSE